MSNIVDQGQDDVLLGLNCLRRSAADDKINQYPALINQLSILIDYQNITSQMVEIPE